MFSVTVRNVLSYGLGKFVGLYVFIFIHKVVKGNIFMMTLQKDKLNPEIVLVLS